MRDPPIRELHSVLVVDDDDAILRSASRVLRRSVEVFVASNSNDALCVAVRERPNVAVVDLVLRDTSGIDLLQRLRIECPKTAVLVMSGLFCARTMQRAFRAGAFDCIEKPFDWDQMLELVQSNPSVDPLSTEIPTFGEVKREYYLSLIHAYGGNVTKAAKHAGIHRTSLQRIKRG